MSPTTYVANALMKAWFPRLRNDQSWIESDDGRNWAEIALLDADVAVKAYEQWIRDFGDDLK